MWVQICDLPTSASQCWDYRYTPPKWQGVQLLNSEERYDVNLMIYKLVEKPLYTIKIDLQRKIFSFS